MGTLFEAGHGQLGSEKEKESELRESVVFSFP